MRSSPILTHFQKNDPQIFQILKASNIELLEPRDPSEYFYRLASNIVSQQLSVKVADVIMKRFDALFNNHKPTPEQVLAIVDDQFRAIGMSWAKVKYVKDLAQKTLDGTLQFEQFTKMTNEQVVDELVKVKGIGKWTAEMFLMFTLGRADLFSLGDLGLKRAMEKIYNLSLETTNEERVLLTEKWSPYRTYACLALWHSLDNKKT